jgi:hypothetical protein
MPFSRFWPASRPSRLIWLFVGTAGAAYWIKHRVWAAKLAELKEKKDQMLEHGQQRWNEKKEQMVERRRQSEDKVSSHLFVISSLTQTISRGSRTVGSLT